MRKLARHTAALGAAALLALSGASFAQAEPVSDQAAQLPIELIQALERDLKLSPDQYLQRSELGQKLAEWSVIARQAYPQVFAGAWLDEKGVPTVALADGPNKAAARAAAEKSGFTVRDVARSAAALESQLGEIQKWIAAQPAPIASAVRGVAIDSIGNTIAIRVSEVLKGLQLPEFLGGARLVVTPQPVVAKPRPALGDIAGVDRGSLLGGDGYGSVAGRMAMQCSFGFNGTFNGATVSVSAGHCDPNLPAAGTPQASKVRELRGEALGPVVGAFEKTSLDNHDYSIIKIVPEATGRFENNGVRVPGRAPLLIDGTAVPLIGAPVCKSGSRTGFSCGTINAVDQSVDVETRRMNDSFSANICALPGDSGGAVVTGTKALGISSASTVADFPVCELAHLIGPFIGQDPQLFSTPINVVLAENPGLQLR